MAISLTFFVCTICALVCCVDAVTTGAFTTAAPLCSAGSSSACCISSATASCPEAFFQTNSTSCPFQQLCRPCHKTCASCRGAFDSDCISCRMRVGNVATQSTNLTTSRSASSTMQPLTTASNSNVTINSTVPQSSNIFFSQQKYAYRVPLIANCSINFTVCPAVGICPRGTFYLNASDLRYSSELVCVCTCPAGMYALQTGNRTACENCTSEQLRDPCNHQCSGLENCREGEETVKWYIVFGAVLGALLLIGGIAAIPVCRIQRRRSLARRKGKEGRMKDFKDIGRPQSGRYVDNPSQPVAREPSTFYDNCSMRNSTIEPQETYDVPSAARHVENATFGSEGNDGNEVYANNEAITIQQSQEINETEVYGNQDVIRQHQAASANEGEELYGNQAVIEKTKATSTKGPTIGPSRGFSQRTGDAAAVNRHHPSTQQPLQTSAVDEQQEPIYVNTQPQEDEQPVYENFQTDSSTQQSTNLDDYGEEYKDMTRSVSLSAKPKLARKPRSLTKARAETAQPTSVQIPTRTPIQSAAAEEDSSEGEEYQLMESWPHAKIRRQQSENEHSQETYGFR